MGIHNDSHDILHPLRLRVTKHAILRAMKSESPNTNFIQLVL